MNSRVAGKLRLNALTCRLLWNLMLVLFTVFSPAASYGQQRFTLTVSDSFSTSTEGFQYRHVEIATSNGLPAAKDISVWCHVEMPNRWGRYSPLIKPIPVTLKAGEVLVEEELYLPSGGQSGTATFSLSPAGNNGRRRLSESAWTDFGTHFQDTLIVDGARVGESQVSFDRSKRLTPQASTSPSYRSIFGRSSDGNEIQLLSLHSKINYLPKRWIGYSCIEQIMIDSADFKTLALDAERFDALLQWVTMGGALIVTDCGEDFNDLPAMMRCFKDRQSMDAAKMRLYCPTDRLKSESEKLQEVQSAGKNYNSGTLRWDASDTVGKNFADNWVPQPVTAGKDGGLDLVRDTEVLLHRYGLGRVMFHAVPLKNLSDEKLLQACFLNLASGHKDNILGAKNAAGDCLEKWHLLNVGIAPIGLFMLVVVSFMTLIGPVGYSYLKINRKLHYQIWLVPLISALACLALLGYALISEGVGTKLRPTIFVELDQKQKVAATFARYSVYSSLQPPPYQFEDYQFATLENAQDLTPAVYRWFDDGYGLSGGNASARNVHQVFVAAPVKTDSGIAIKNASDSESPASLSLTNNFKDHIKLLVVKVDGELYFALDLAPSETQLRAPAFGDEFSQSDEVKRVLRDRIPTNGQNYRFNGRRGFYNRRPSSYQKQWDVGVKRIEQFRSTSGIVENLEEGHYIAILDSITEVPSVVSNAREIDGSVIVHGKW